MEQNFLVDQFFKGGPMMWAMLLCSLIALGVIIDRLWNLMRVPGEQEADRRVRPPRARREGEALWHEVVRVQIVVRA